MCNRGGLYFAQMHRCNEVTRKWISYTFAHIGFRRGPWLELLNIGVCARDIT